MYVAVILIVGVGIAYAALSTTLDITFNTVTQNALTWNVAFQTGEVSPTVGGTSSTGRSCGNAIVTADSVTVAATSVSKPGDKCTYELIIENTGTVNARLNAITPTAPSLPTVCQTAAGGVLECNNISYKLTTDAAGTVIYTAGGTIQANHTQTIYLVVSYIPTNTVQSTTDTQTNGKFTLSYMQA
jgi:hypothetical protein